MKPRAKKWLAMAAWALIPAVLFAYVNCLQKKCPPVFQYPSHQDFFAMGEEMDKVTRAFHRAVIKAPPFSEFADIGQRQRILHSLDIIASESGYICRYDGHYVVLKATADQTYKVELRWLGANATVRRMGKELEVVFNNDFRRGQAGYYLYTIYDSNNVVWHTFLYDIYSEKEDLIVANCSCITACEDRKLLQKNSPVIFSAP